MVGRFSRLNKIKESSNNLCAGANLKRMTIDLSSKRFINAYILKLDKNKFNFRVANSKTPLPVKDVLNVSRKNRFQCCINVGARFLTDDGSTARFDGYNLFVTNGKVWQFPKNSRVTLISKNGKLRIKTLMPIGRIKIGDEILDMNDTGVQTFGIFDVDIEKVEGKRKIIKKTKLVVCGSDEILLGCNFDVDSVYVTSFGQKLDLLKNVFILKSKRDSLLKVRLHDEVKLLEIGGIRISDSLNMVSAQFSIPKNKNQLVKSLQSELISTDGSISVLRNDYIKSWSIIGKTKSRIYFIVIDARPKVRGQEGMHLLELHKFLYKDIKLSSAICCDSGQSSRISMIKDCKLVQFGNLHYRDFSKSIVKWDGLRGRTTNSVLIAEQI